jgi:hypothetical protein
MPDTPPAAYTYLQTLSGVIYDLWSQGSSSSNAKHLKGEKEKQDKLEDSSSHRKTTKK